ncbi:MAG: FecCD family ABC transporter permease [Candidatus Methanomethylophilaceae archaeon]
MTITDAIRSTDDAVDIWAEDDVRHAETYSEDVREYDRSLFRKLVFIACCIVLAFIIAGYALSVGDYSISFTETYAVLWDHITGNVTDPDGDFIVWTLRLPRILTGLLAGIGLAAAGAVMQTILRNPSADPYTTGLSSGASFGATLAVGLGISVASASYAIVMNAFIFSLVPIAVIIFVSKLKSASPTTMIMAGIAVMYIFNAVNTMVRLWLDPETQSFLYAWSVGSLEGITWDGIAVMGVVTIFVVFALMIMARKLNVISTGDELSRSIGVDPESIRILALVLISMLTAAVVSFTGLIGFVGLVCPHIARIFVGSNNRFLIPASAAFGAALLLAADVVGRTILAPSIIQVGVITAFIGGPMFLYLIVKQKREVA